MKVWWRVMASIGELKISILCYFQGRTSVPEYQPKKRKTPDRNQKTDLGRVFQIFFILSVCFLLSTVSVGEVYLDERVEKGG